MTIKIVAAGEKSFFEVAKLVAAIYQRSSVYNEISFLITLQTNYEEGQDPIHVGTKSKEIDWDSWIFFNYSDKPRYDINLTFEKWVWERKNLSFNHYSDSIKRQYHDGESFLNIPAINNSTDCYNSFFELNEKGEFVFSKINFDSKRYDNDIEYKKKEKRIFYILQRPRIELKMGYEIDTIDETKSNLNIHNSYIQLLSMCKKVKELNQLKVPILITPPLDQKASDKQWDLTFNPSWFYFNDDEDKHWQEMIDNEERAMDRETDGDWRWNID